MGNVNLKTVTKEYNGIIAVNNLDIKIDDGEFISLVGPSGCGKSTTLECVAGLTKPTDGEVEIAGRNVTDLPPKDRDIAMVFQNIALFPHINVYDNISFGLRLKVNNYSEDEIDNRVQHARKILQLDGMLDRMPSELSGGQQQRVAIGRAIVREPEVFLMDEPLANLDAKLRVHMRTEIQRIHKELDTTVIYVTHDQEEAMTMSDRVAIMSDGKLQQIAPPLTCYNEPINQFVASFIGSPSMNFFEGELNGGMFSSPLLTGDIKCSNQNFNTDDVSMLGIRPEDIYFEHAEIDHPSESFNVITDVLEPIGNEVYVYFQLSDQKGNNQSLMSVSPDTEIEENQRIEVIFDRSQIHLFNSATGKALSHDLVSEKDSPITRD